MTRTSPDIMLASIQLAVARDFLARVLVPERDRPAIEAIEHCLAYVEADIEARSSVTERES